jgi:long-chain acyl-CoA synthetase
MSLNLITLLKEGAKLHPQRQALVMGGQAVSYGDLIDQAQRLSRALRQAGVQRGQAIALLLPNVPQFSTAYFAAHNLGCPLIPLNVLSTAEEIVYYLQDSEATAIVT